MIEFTDLQNFGVNRMLFRIISPKNLNFDGNVVDMSFCCSNNRKLSLSATFGRDFINK
jgi:hypothetical protein